MNKISCVAVGGLEMVVFVAVVVVAAAAVAADGVVVAAVDGVVVSVDAEAVAYHWVSHLVHHQL